MAERDPENVMGRTRADNANYVVSRLQSFLGNPLPPGSRLERMRRALNRGHISPDHADFLVALEAERDMQYLGFVFDQPNPHTDYPSFRGILKRVVSDSVLPQDDLDRSEGRDAQFELYVAAICQKAGLFPVAYGKPDVTCVIAGTQFGIEAKRVKSMTQLEKRFKKAAHQIAEAKLPGIVAIDLSLALNRENLPVVSSVQSQLYEMIAPVKGDWFAREYMRNVDYWVRGNGVHGVLVFDSTIRCRANLEWGMDGSIYWYPTAEGDERTKLEGELFYEAFMQGIPNRTDL